MFWLLFRYEIRTSKGEKQYFGISEQGRWRMNNRLGNEDCNRGQLQSPCVGKQGPTEMQAESPGLGVCSGRRIRATDRLFLETAHSTS